MKFRPHNLKCGASDEVELPPASSELTHPVFPTTSMVAGGLLNTGKCRKNERTLVIAVGDLVI
jgi:hypothetical protein